MDNPLDDKVVDGIISDYFYGRTEMLPFSNTPPSFTDVNGTCYTVVFKGVDVRCCKVGVYGDYIMRSAEQVFINGHPLYSEEADIQIGYSLQQRDLLTFSRSSELGMRRSAQIISVD